jgi:ankyrin repeat protein
MHALQRCYQNARDNFFPSAFMAAHQPLPEKSADVDVLPDEDYDSDQLEAELGKIAELGQALIDAVLEYLPIEDLQKLLDEDAPLWYQDECGWSALHAAASVENAELVKSLLQRGALWNAGKTRSLTCSSRICEMHT